MNWCMSPSSAALRCRGQRDQRGVALIEALIAMLLIALWMLSSAGLQVSSLKFQKGAGNRFQAVVLAAELGESIEANNVGAKAGNYALDPVSAPVSASTDCAASYCTPLQLSSFDLAQWTTRIAAALPMKEVSVVAGTSASGLVTYTIRISWVEPRGRQTYSSTGSTETLSFVLTKVVRNAST